MTRYLVVVAVVAALAAGCSEEPAAGSGADIVEQGADEPSEAPPDESDVDESDEAEEQAEAEEQTEAAEGTRDNPVPVGTTVRVGDWEVTVVEVTADATDAVMAENEFNDPPADGRQFVLWSVDATYTGADSGDPWIDLQWTVVGSEGNSFATGEDDWCGVIPSPLDEQGETFPGATVSGNVCVSVPSSQVDGGSVMVEPFLADGRTFFAISS